MELEDVGDEMMEIMMCNNEGIKRKGGKFK